MRNHLALVFAATVCAAAAQAQSDDGTTFRWSGTVPSGQSIRLHNMNGDIRVERSSGSEVEVIAERRVERGDPKTVTFALRTRDDGDVVVCALWGPDMRCTDDGSRGSYNARSIGWRRSDNISVTMRVRVPDGVKAYARSTNGSVDIRGMTSDVDAFTTNGDVNVRTTGGRVNAATTNGSVTASLGRLSGSEPMRFTTTNGSVTVYASQALDADVELSTTNGGVTTDFPMAISGRIARNSVRGTLGQGGRTIVVRSTNGDVALKRNGI